MQKHKKENMNYVKHLKANLSISKKCLKTILHETGDLIVFYTKRRYCMNKFEIDGEVFEIVKIENTIAPDCGKYKTSYREEKDARTGVLIIDRTVQKVRNKLERISNIFKIIL